MTTTLDGVTLHVADVERSLAFYQQLLPEAAVAVHRPGQFALLQLGTARLALLKEGTYPFHIELGTTDVDALHARLAAAGVSTDGPPRQRWGDRGFLVTDPDGHQLEFSSAERSDGLESNAR